VDPLKEQTAPETDVVQVVVGVNSVGTVRVILRRFVSGIVKGEVIVIVMLDVYSNTKELDGV